MHASDLYGTARHLNRDTAQVQAIGPCNIWTTASDLYGTAKRLNRDTAQVQAIGPCNTWATAPNQHSGVCPGQSLDVRTQRAASA